MQRHGGNWLDWSGYSENVFLMLGWQRRVFLYSSLGIVVRAFSQWYAKLALLAMGIHHFSWDPMKF